MLPRDEESATTRVLGLAGTSQSRRPIEVSQHEDVDQFGAGSRAEGVEVGS